MSGEERPRGLEELNNWFQDGEPTEVHKRDLVKFMDKAAEYWQVPGLRGENYANAIYNAGYQNNVLVAALTQKDLENIGFTAGHAKLVSRHLGGFEEPVGAPPEIRVVVAPVTSLTLTLAGVWNIKGTNQTSLDSVHDVVREKEEKWRQRHRNNLSQKVRMQTLI